VTVIAGAPRLGRRVLVTGGTGFLGRRTVRALLEAGHDVRLIVRDRARAAEAFGDLPVDVAAGAPTDPHALDAALAGRDVVIHAAATYRYERSAAASVAPNAALARTVLEAAGRAHVERVVDVSSIVVFSLRSRRVDEATPLTRPGEPGWDDPYLRSKVLAEDVGRELEGLGLPRVTVYPGLIVGPDDSGPGTSGGIVVSLLRGAAMPDTRGAWVDVRDVARGIVAALDTPIGSRYLLSEGVHRYREVAATLDRLTGRRRRRVFLPGAAMRLLARANDALGGRMERVPPAGSLDYVLLNGPEVDGSKATRELGLSYRPLEETLADALRWWAANGTVERRLIDRLA
jgi:dihydroflavonol-4-reductase